MGELLESLKHGIGQENFANGDIYRGTYVNGKPHGHRGQFDFGFRHGLGEYTSPKDEKYVGNYAKDTKNGQGKYTWPNGTTYTGQFMDDKRHGIGSMKFFDGSYYQGEWCMGKMNGRGKMVQGVSVINGIWKDNIYEKEVSLNLQAMMQTMQQTT